MSGNFVLFRFCTLQFYALSLGQECMKSLRVTTHYKFAKVKPVFYFNLLSQKCVEDTEFIGSQEGRLRESIFTMVHFRKARSRILLTQQPSFFPFAIYTLCRHAGYSYAAIMEGANNSFVGRHFVIDLASGSSYSLLQWSPLVRATDKRSFHL